MMSSAIMDSTKTVVDNLWGVVGTFKPKEFTVTGDNEPTNPLVIKKDNILARWDDDDVASTPEEEWYGAGKTTTTYKVLAQHKTKELFNSVGDHVDDDIPANKWDDDDVVHTAAHEEWYGVGMKAATSPFQSKEFHVVSSKVENKEEEEAWEQEAIHSPDELWYGNNYN